MKTTEIKTTKEKEKEERIHNVAIIQYLLENGTMKLLIISDNDMKKLKHRVSIHMDKKVSCIQFYYSLTKGQLHLIKEGVIYE